MDGTASFDVSYDEASMTIELTGPLDATLLLRSVEALADHPDPSSPISLILQPTSRPSKTFTLDLERGAIRVTYTLYRDASATSDTYASPIAPWEITRAGAGGITFWPTDPGASATGGLAAETTGSANATWYEHESTANGDKLFTGALALAAPCPR